MRDRCCPLGSPETGVLNVATEWGIRLLDGTVKPADSRSKAEYWAAEGNKAAESIGAQGKCVVVSRAVVTRIHRENWAVA